MQPPAKFFVNQGVVTSREDMLNLLRPLLKQTVSYRYLRGAKVAAHGNRGVERIVVDQAGSVDVLQPPIAITLNVDSFEHLTSRPGRISCSSTRSSRATTRSSWSSTQAAMAAVPRSSRGSSPSTRRAMSRWSSRAGFGAGRGVAGTSEEVRASILSPVERQSMRRRPWPSHHLQRPRTSAAVLASRRSRSMVMAVEIRGHPLRGVARGDSSVRRRPEDRPARPAPRPGCQRAPPRAARASRSPRSWPPSQRGHGADRAARRWRLEPGALRGPALRLREPRGLPRGLHRERRRGGGSEQVFRSLARKGFNFIIGTSFGYWTRWRRLPPSSGHTFLHLTASSRTARTSATSSARWRTSSTSRHAPGSRAKKDGNPKVG